MNGEEGVGKSGELKFTPISKKFVHISASFPLLNSNLDSKTSRHIANIMDLRLTARMR
jgi:hypothetical protein